MIIRKTSFKFTPSRHLRLYLSKIRETMEPLNYIIFTVTVVSYGKKRDFELIATLE